MFELPIGTGLVGDALGDAYERATDRPVKFKFSCGASVHAQRMPDPVAFVAETSARRAHQELNRLSMSAQTSRGCKGYPGLLSPMAAAKLH
ncbi:hypothetical protein AK812_SmicGene46339 [Symbiodinium microadriaticum]|uniref:Uncharacterized protein n=1 Tax=Symbiodinium microadriaticum TaxID=2951 RepID=A0A1Q9BU84_SYMMI|nr:hypothetical protein AK812_SmicGene46339 [Symbiodinium microadriaticum]CAE7220489.1 unnamed protein product [Symbiodinium sp. KB8]CAE7863499.1 unnamed protein product [Symbiodinium microadriaticum]